MTKVLVNSDSSNFSEYYNFDQVPRVGELVFICSDEDPKERDLKFIVKVVEHYPSYGIRQDDESYTTIQCEIAQ